MIYLKKVLSIDSLGDLTLQEKKSFFLLLMLMIVFLFIKAFTYSLITPYLNVVIDPNMIFSIQELKFVIDCFGWMEPITLVSLLAILFMKQFLFALYLVGFIGTLGLLIYIFLKARQRKQGYAYEQGFFGFYTLGLESFQLFKEINIFNKKT